MAKARKRKSTSGTPRKVQRLVERYRNAKNQWRAKERASGHAAARVHRLRRQILAAMGDPYRIIAQAVRYARTPEGKLRLEAYGLKSIKALGARKRGSRPPKVEPWKGALPFSIGPIIDGELACALYIDVVEEPLEMEGTFEMGDDPLPPNMVAECYAMYCDSCRPRHQGNSEGGVIWCECQAEGYPVG